MSRYGECHSSACSDSLPTGLMERFDSGTLAHSLARRPSDTSGTQEGT